MVKSCTRQGNFCWISQPSTASWELNQATLWQWACLVSDFVLSQWEIQNPYHMYYVSFFLGQQIQVFDTSKIGHLAAKMELDSTAP